jgi:Tfp pilus assembly protein PilN
MIQPAINLASQPFRRDRPVLAAAALLSGVLLVVLVMLVSIEITERSQLSDTRATISRLERQLRGLASEQAELENVLRRPENAEVLERSLFLNTLLYRKGISWTRIFADLEKIVPYNVRVISIQPQVYERNRIYLNMMVGAEATEPVVDLLMKLEGSDAFGATSIHSSLPPSQTEPLYRYRLSVSYAQKF